MTDQPTGTAPEIAVGAVVKHRSRGLEWRGVTGVAQPMEGWPGAAIVQWSNRAGESWERVVDPEVIAPPVLTSTAPADLWDGPVTLSTEYVYAPERALAPGIVVSADTCGGRPRLAGTRMPTDTARRWPDYAAYHAAYPHISQEQYERAACFEAGRRDAKEQQKAKKERRKAKQAKGGKGGATEGR